MMYPTGWFMLVSLRTMGNSWMVPPWTNPPVIRTSFMTPPVPQSTEVQACHVVTRGSQVVLSWRTFSCVWYTLLISYHYVCADAAYVYANLIKSWRFETARKVEHLQVVLAASMLGTTPPAAPQQRVLHDTLAKLQGGGQPANHQQLGLAAGDELTRTIH